MCGERPARKKVEEENIIICYTEQNFQVSYSTNSPLVNSSNTMLVMLL